MYKSYSSAQYRDYFNLPVNYCIDAMLVAGTFSRELELPKLISALQESHKPYELKQLPVTESYGKAFFEPILELHLNGQVIWYFVAYGGALLSEYLHFGYLFGAKKTVLVGSCGGLKPEAQSGDVIIPIASQADGSTAHMYDRSHQALQPADKVLSADLAQQCSKQKLTVHRGNTMTCQAMVAETWEDVKQWSHDGYIGVEMEAATVFAVSNHFKRSSAAILSIADNLIKKESNVTHKTEVAEESRRRVKEMQYQAAIKLLQKVSS